MYQLLSTCVLLNSPQQPNKYYHHSFYRWENWGADSICGLSMVIWTESVSAGIWILFHQIQKKIYCVHLPHITCPQPIYGCGKNVFGWLSAPICSSNDRMKVISSKKWKAKIITQRNWVFWTTISSSLPDSFCFMTAEKYPSKLWRYLPKNMSRDGPRHSE